MVKYCSNWVFNSVIYFMWTKSYYIKWCDYNINTFIYSRAEKYTDILSTYMVISRKAFSQVEHFSTELNFNIQLIYINVYR